MDSASSFITASSQEAAAVANQAPSDKQEESRRGADSVSRDATASGIRTPWDPVDATAATTPPVQIVDQFEDAPPTVGNVIDTPALLDSDDYEEEDPNSTTGVGAIPVPEDDEEDAGPSLSDNREENVHQIQQDILNVVATVSQRSSPRTNAAAVNNDDDDDDVASRAAVALAAVAAAASASHKSPAEAAKEARLVAQTFIKDATNDAGKSSKSQSHMNNANGNGGNGASGGSNRRRTLSREGSFKNGTPRWHTLPVATVKAHLRQRSLEMTSSALLDKLTQGENDALLQHLLLLEYVRCNTAEDTDDSPKEHDATINSDLDTNHSAHSSNNNMADEARNAAASDACERVIALLRKMEGAYDSLLQSLPHVSNYQRQQSNSDGDDYETPIIVPDLLPPCVVPRGDATVAFFRACMGNDTEATRKSSVELDSTSSPTKISSPTHAAHHAAHAAGAASSSGSMFAMFKRSAGHNATNMTSNNASAASAAAASMSTSAKSLFGSFRSSGATKRKDDGTAASSSMSSDTGPVPVRPGEYSVTIEREMLGLTVENVLERTVVRTVLAGGPAKKAGAKVGSLIVKVANVETKNLTHFETIDELRQSQRPLHLVLRHVSDDALRAARSEMGRLIRGAGFGTILDGAHHHHHHKNDGSAGGGAAHADSDAEAAPPSRPLIGADLRIDAVTNYIRRRMHEAGPTPKNKKEEALARVGEKLVWIMTLFVIGLEREASRAQQAAAVAAHELPSESPSRQQPGIASHHTSLNSMYPHGAKDLSDAAKSMAKVLLDYTRKRLDASPPSSSHPQKSRAAGFIQNSLDAVGGGSNRRRKGPPPPPSPMGGRGGGAGRGGKLQAVPGAAVKDNSSLPHERPLLQIGDVLQRARTFWADTTSTPAALLRGEVIALLCDVLDIDTDMELSEDDAFSLNAGGQAGAVSDLGSAGGLLKLIILNCPIMRSPGCQAVDTVGPELEDELKRRSGTKDVSDVDLHKLHAGNRFLSVVHRLAASRSTSARITACSLGPVIWGHLDFPHQLQLRGVITRALHDVEVVVRKATAHVLHEIAELVFDTRCVPWLVLMCERAMTDPEPQLRSAAMTLTWHLAEHLPNAFLGDASQGSRYLRRLPQRSDPIFADVYLLQCKLLPVATRLADDRSPSVRLAVAAQCDRLCDAMGDHWSSVIIDVLLALLSDTDERVRCEAVLCVPRLADIVLLSTAPGESSVSEDSVIEALVPASIKMQSDASSSVRVALASAAGEMLTVMVALQKRQDEAHVLNASSSSFDNQATAERPTEMEGGRQFKRLVDERLIPLVQKLLNDRDPEVTSASLRAVTNASRRSVPSSVPSSRSRHLSVTSMEDDSVSLSSYASRDSRQPVFLPVLSEVQVLRLLPTLAKLADSKQWRVRQSAVEIVPALLGCTQKIETRSEISKLCIRLMNDKVDTVRRTAAECLCMGGTSLGTHTGKEDAGAEWTCAIVIPAIRNCALASQAKQRLLSLKMVEVILVNGVCPAEWKGSDENRMTDSPMRELAAIALSLTTDRIANVRLNVGRILAGVMQQFEEDELAFIKEVLVQQIESEREREGGGDVDVLYFAEQCVRKAKTLLEGELPTAPTSAVKAEHLQI